MKQSILREINNLDEPLFFDKKRIKEYGDFLFPGLKFEKSSKFKLELSLTGPKIIFERNSHPRELNNKEIIQKLIKYIEKKSGKENYLFLKRLDLNIPIKNKKLPIYVFEKLKATKFIIPFKPSSEFEVDLKGLPIWISSEKGNVNMLCLIEDVNNSITRNPVISISGFTLLLSIFSSLKEKYAKTVLIDTYGDGEINFKKQFNNFNNKLFFENPTQTLTNLGGIKFYERNIKTLYKIRSFGPEENKQRKSISSVGYPIFIYEDGI